MGKNKPLWQLCTKFAAATGTVVSDTAVLRLTSMVKIGTATSGIPMPTTPLTVLPAKRPSEQRNRRKGVTPAPGQAFQRRRRGLPAALSFPDSSMDGRPSPEKSPFP